MSWRDVVKKITVEPVLLLYMCASFISFPTNQFVLSNKICNDEYGANSSFICPNLHFSNYSAEEKYVAGETSMWILFLTLAYLLPSVVISALVGSWSDLYGKKCVMLLPLCGSLIEKVMFLFGVLYINSLPTWYFLFGAVIAGCSGGFIVALQTVFSYLADVTTVEERSVRIALLESMTFVGALAGSLLITFLLGKVDPYIIYVVILLLLLSGVIYIVLRIDNIVPPHHQDGDRPHIQPVALWDMKHIRNCYTETFRRREDGKRTDLVLLLLCMFLFVVALAGERDISYLYLTNTPLKFAPSQYGYYQFTYYTLLSISLIVGLPLLKRRFHLHDMTICVVGSLSKLASLILFSFSTHTWMVYLAVSLGAFTLMAPASIRSSISKLALADEQGKVFAVLASLENVSALIASSILNPVYKSSLYFWPGLVYIICAVFVASVSILSSFLRYRMRTVCTSHFQPLPDLNSAPD